MIRTLLAGAAALGLMAGPALAADGDMARAAMKTAEGAGAGTVTLRETPHGVLVHAGLSGLPEGTHGFHIHETGKCTPDFEAAGGHFAGEGDGHGFLSENGPHAGDLPNIHILDRSRFAVEFFASGLTLDEVLDDDGAAVVVYSGADDYRTDPAGESGSRIACGVLERMAGAGQSR
ncbi:MAG: superoxide dismutase family protein [Alphaproteobacteria bacterium]|nr:superoxide dismutase family protein [Alphaproteobacteria bacterium]